VHYLTYDLSWFGWWFIRFGFILITICTILLQYLHASLLQYLHAQFFFDVIHVVCLTHMPLGMRYDTHYNSSWSFTSSLTMALSLLVTICEAVLIVQKLLEPLSDTRGSWQLTVKKERHTKQTHNLSPFYSLSLSFSLSLSLSFPLSFPVSLFLSLTLFLFLSQSLSFSPNLSNANTFLLTNWCIYCHMYCAQLRTS